MEFPPSRARTFAFAVFSAAGSFGAGIGGMIAGLLTTHTRLVSFSFLSSQGETKSLLRSRNETCANRAFLLL